MLKMIVRFLVVMGMVGVFAYGLYELVLNYSAALGINTSQGAGHAHQIQPPAGALSEGRMAKHGHDGNNQQGIVLGLMGIVRNLGIIAAITLVVIAVRKVLRLIFAGRRTQPA